MTETQALTIANRTALQVDDGEAKEYAKQLLTHASAGNALFPKDLSQSQAVVLARLALAYGLDPIAGEIIPYQGKAYVTIDGRVRKAQENPAYDGLECVPATDDERKAFRCSDDEHLWIARVWRKDRRVPFVGYGRSGGKGDRNPVSREYGAEMAQKRAKARALRDAFSMPLPSYEDEEPRHTRPAVSYSAPVIDHEAGRYIDVETGVIEGEYAEATEGPLASQTRKIHTLVGKLGWDDDEYRTLLREAFGVESSTDMTEGQAAALSETLAALYGVADFEHATVRVQDAVAAMKKRAAKLRAVEGDDDPAWQRAQERDAERKAALDAAGMDTPLESAAQQVTLTDAEYREIAADDAPMFTDAEAAPPSEPLPARETPAQKSARRTAMETKIKQYLSAGAALGMDLAPYEYDESTSDGALEAKGVKLAAAIKALTEPAKQAATT
jgi:hypothetical protein